MDRLPDKHPEESVIDSMIEYKKKVDILVDSLSDIVDETDLARVRHLVVHGEPSEGLIWLAWTIRKENLVISNSDRKLIYELTDVDSREFLPPNFK